jgi:predicted RNase H-like nuclease (RuvC/YqgF family)
VERPSEYTLDRKNREIKELRRSNYDLRDVLYHKDKELSEMKQQLKEADSASTIFATAFVVTLMVSILFVLHVFTSRGT